MKIELIHPPHINSTDDRLDPPMGLMLIAAHLEKNNINVGITDLSGIEEKQWNIPYADIYGITVYITSMQVTNDIIDKCRKINPNCKIVVGGAHPSARPEDFLLVDHVVMGYGEVSMVDIALGKETRHIINGIKPEDLFIFPAYHLVNLKSYHRKIDGKTSVPYLTSRGCPYKCAFCGLNKMHDLSKGVHFASVETVTDQLIKIKHELGIDRIAFQDDIFTMQINRLKGILRIVKKLKIKFRCMGRAGMDKKETYKLLSDSGCEQVSWGIESGSQYMLDRMNKQVKVQDNYDVIGWAKKYKINSRAFFIIGFPGETKETLEETKNFIMKSDVDQYFISNFTPYPGTEVGDNPEKFGITNILKDYSKFYQIGKDGYGGITIDTEWLSMVEFKELEYEFRNWLKINKSFKGEKQDYEKKLYVEENK